MTAPRRIQLRRTKGWRLHDISPDAVVVTRSSKWGNPFAIGKTLLVERYYPTFARVDITPRDRREAVAWFSLVLGPDWGLPVPMRSADVRRELAGHDLACWCPLGQPCHADVLLEIANQVGGAP
ncbi:hypothetical protein DSM43518_02053 [Mycobacterium marinum]|uniref:DUF4326 domain-containing protein n=1 Tax=Mycobacterium marinum TaxID=1781 RepID=UPI000ED9EFD4|nr:DUF4326 domain-containing protein [Mycobacterium marinum]RFZ11213.1 hypothetical protein DSM43518_02053 [Mycobacterium marinum]